MRGAVLTLDFDLGVYLENMSRSTVTQAREQEDPEAYTHLGCPSLLGMSKASQGP